MWTRGPDLDLHARFSHRAVSSVTVSDDVRLTITADTVIKFGANYQLSVYGTLDANGSEESRVVFTSLKDDDYDGDTNGDGDSHAPASGDWHGIYLNGRRTMTASVSSTTAWYATAANCWQCRCQCVVQCFGFGPYHQQHQRIQVQDGIKIANCSPQISGSTLANNTLYGIHGFLGRSKDH